MALLASVGENGRNLEQDVRKVQSLLTAAGWNPGRIDGICGPKTIAAIRMFQAGVLSEPDGLIEPGKVTWRSLSSEGATPGGNGTASPTGDSSRWPQEQKLLSLTPELRPKVRVVLDALKNRGFQPEIFYGWRSVKVQLELVKKGNSTVKFSFHNAQKPDGTPNSYAADIVDRRYLWESQAESSGFWKALGEEAERQGLTWGGRWSSFRDWAHVQLVENSRLQEIKQQSGL